MSVQACGGCGQSLAWGLLRCPRCQTVAPLFAGRVKEEQMPHITVAGGPSNAAAAPGEVGYVGPDPTETPTGQAVIEPSPEPETAPDGEAEPADTSWAAMPLAQLREHAKSRGLSTSGPKADLAARIAAYDTEQPADLEAVAEEAA